MENNTNRIPFKVIHKYTNKDNITVYSIYVFVGQCAKPIKNVLAKIQDMSLHDLLLKLDPKCNKILDDFYGHGWFRYFYNKHHIGLVKKELKTNKQFRDGIKKRWGEKILNEIGQYLTAVVSMEGGAPAQNIEDELFSGYDDNNENTAIINTNEEDEVVDNDQENIDEPNEEVVQNIDTLLVGADEKPAFKRPQDEKKKQSIARYNTEENESITKKIDLSNVYKKIFIYDHFIYQDDSLFTVQAKVCDTVFLPNRFKHHYLMPSRLYFWGEYLVGKDYQKHPIGIEWTRTSDRFKPEVEPRNDVEDYIYLREAELRDLEYSFKKYGSRQAVRSTCYHILSDYIRYMHNNEIFMVDVYTQLSLVVNEIKTNQELGNLRNVFIKLYFPQSVSDFVNIVGYLKEDQVDTTHPTGSTFQTEVEVMAAYNSTNHIDIGMESSITSIVDEFQSTQKPKSDTGNFSSVSTTHTMVQYKLDFPFDMMPFGNLNLRRLLLRFQPSDKYPFVRYYVKNSPPYRMVYRPHFKDLPGAEIILMNWMGVSNIGALTVKCSMKHFTDNSNEGQYATLNLSEKGVLQAKFQWKESQHYNVYDKEVVRKVIASFIDEINKTNKISVPVPESPSDLQYVFVNALQSFQLSKPINHNDLSDFARMFYPYVSVVIDPKKRTGSRNTDFSKYGTYLRYRRLSNNQSDSGIRNRIIHYARNYDVTPSQIVTVIEAEFSIPKEDAKKYVEEVLRKEIKKSNVVQPASALQVPKFKPKSVSIDIQGKQLDQQKIRVTGARSVAQLEEILMFVKTLLVLYDETYLSKKASRKGIISTLSAIQKTARRRHKVLAVTHSSNNPRSDGRSSLNILKEDATHTALQHNTGNNYYSRECQNMGKIRRRPTQVKGVAALKKLGYRFDVKTNVYVHTKTGHMAIKLPGATQDVFFTCNFPAKHGQYRHVGVLTKSAGFLPCCFKKNQLYSYNPTIRRKFEQAVQKPSNKEDDTLLKPPSMSYVRTIHNKISHQRVYSLPESLSKHLDPKHHFIYGINTPFESFLVPLSIVFNKQISELKSLIQTTLENKQNSLFTSCNKGAIRMRFGTPKNFVDYVMKEKNMGHGWLLDVMRETLNVNIVVVGLTENINDEKAFVYCTTMSEDRLCVVLVFWKRKYHLLTHYADKKVTFLFPPNGQTSQVIQRSINGCQSDCYIKPLDVAKFTKEKIKYQVVDDVTFQVCFVITKSNRILPTSPCAADVNIPVLTKSEFVDKKMFKSPKDQYDDMKELPWVHVDSYTQQEKDQEGKVVVIAINATVRAPGHFVERQVIIPVRQVQETLPIPVELLRHQVEHDRAVMDVRVRDVKDEMYQVLRLELSNYLSREEKKADGLRKLLLSPSSPQKMDTKQLVRDVYQYIRKEVLPDLVHTNNLTSKEWVSQHYDDVVRYHPLGVRFLCVDKKGDHKLFCETTRVSVPRDWLNLFVSHISYDVATQSIEGKEVMRLDRHYVSNISLVDNPDPPKDVTVIQGNSNFEHIIAEILGVALNSTKEAKENLSVKSAIKEKDGSLTIPVRYKKGNPGLVIGETLLLSAGYSESANMAAYLQGKAFSWADKNVDTIRPGKGLGGVQYNISTLTDLHQHGPKSLQDWLVYLWVCHGYLQKPVLVLNANNLVQYYFHERKVVKTTEHLEEGTLVVRIPSTKSNVVMNRNSQCPVDLDAVRFYGLKTKT